jgi:hypothetical protein
MLHRGCGATRAADTAPSAHCSARRTDRPATTSAVVWRALTCTPGAVPPALARNLAEGPFLSVEAPSPPNPTVAPFRDSRRSHRSRRALQCEAAWLRTNADEPQRDGDEPKHDAHWLQAESLAENARLAAIMGRENASGGSRMTRSGTRFEVRTMLAKRSERVNSLRLSLSSKSRHLAAARETQHSLRRMRNNKRGTPFAKMRTLLDLRAKLFGLRGKDFVISATLAELRSAQSSFRLSFSSKCLVSRLPARCDIVSGARETRKGGHASTKWGRSST